jgi:5-methylcytosine-specific restriction protein B
VADELDTDAHRQRQQRSKQLIEEAVIKIAKNRPQDITADDVRRELGDAVIGDPDFKSEMMGGAFSALSQRGLIESLGSRTSQAPGMKNRRVTIYRATQKLLRQLGMAPQPGSPAGKTADVLTAIYGYAQQRGFICTLTDIVNFYLSMQAKPFVVLSGISGTGKSLLPRLFATALGAPLASIPVKPNWTDNSYLMGYYSVTLNDFVPGPLTTAIQAALQKPEQPFFVRLDEMNLAHVEHYLSDLLSVMETVEKDSKGAVRTECLPFNLPAVLRESDAPRQRRWTTLENLYLPSNLFLIGTVNVDETTHPFSKKVLDRAFTIDFSRVELTSFGAKQSKIPPPELPIATAPDFLLDRPVSVQEIYSLDEPFFDAIAAKLDEANGYLAEADLHFAYRIRDEICLYMWAWKRHQLDELVSENDAFDLCLLQKVFPRCHGTSETARRVLQRLFFFCCGDSPTDEPLDLEQLDARHPVASRLYRLSSQKVARMLRQYRDTGIFSFWAG